MNLNNSSPQHGDVEAKSVRGVTSRKLHVFSDCYKLEAIGQPRNGVNKCWTLAAASDWLVALDDASSVIHYTASAIKK
jgi:hypothetical protein